ncbi:hypothetical protein DMUE_3516 [Dictyocoela muelleri]|nr:hypothetical protein DMUE_3516 [Dictyocoela muelleri]
MEQSKKTTGGVKNLISFYEAIISNNNNSIVLEKERGVSKMQEKVTKVNLTDNVGKVQLANNVSFLTKNKIDENIKILSKIEINKGDVRRNVDNELIKDEKIISHEEEFNGVKVNSNYESVNKEDNEFNFNKTFKEVSDAYIISNELNFYEGNIKFKENYDKENKNESKNVKYNENDLDQFNIVNPIEMIKNHGEKGVYQKSLNENFIEKEYIDTKNIPSVKYSIEKFEKNVENSGFKEKESLGLKGKDIEINDINSSSPRAEVKNYYLVAHVKKNSDEIEGSRGFSIEEVYRRPEVHKINKLIVLQNDQKKQDYEKPEKILKIQSGFVKLNNKLSDTLIVNAHENQNEKGLKCELHIPQTEIIPFENQLKVLSMKKLEEKANDSIQLYKKIALQPSEDYDRNSSDIVEIQKMDPQSETIKDVSEKKNLINLHSNEVESLSKETQFLCLGEEDSFTEKQQKFLIIPFKYHGIKKISNEIINESINMNIEHSALKNETYSRQAVVSKTRFDPFNESDEVQSEDNEFIALTFDPKLLLTSEHNLLKCHNYHSNSEEDEDENQQHINSHYEKSNRNARNIIKSRVIQKGFFSGLWSTIMNELCCCLGEQKNTTDVNPGIYDLLDHITQNCCDKEDILNLPCEEEQYLLILNLIARNQNVDFNKFSLVQCVSALKKYIRDDLDGLLDNEMSKIILTDLFECGKESEKIIHDYGKLTMSQDRLLILLKLLEMFMAIDDYENDIVYNELVDEFSPYIFTLGEVSKVCGENVLKAARLICDPYYLM